MLKLFIVPTNTCFGLWCFLADIESYNKIYKIKWRDFSKPLAIFLDSLSTLKNISNLTAEQIDFLQNYDKPWTILIDKKNIKNKNIIQNIDKLPNADIYEKIGFRIAHNFMHKKLIKKWWFFFLTSANKTGDKEIKSSTFVREYFKKEIEKYDIKVFAHQDFIIESSYDFSDIFEFTKDWIRYLRKN